MTITVVASALLTGTLIGAVGVGGVLLAPLLVFLTDLELHEAMAVASFSFFFTGLAGALSYASHKSIDWHLTGFLSLGIIPAAIIGAYVNTRLNSCILGFFLALLTLFAGLNTLQKRNATPLWKEKPSSRTSLLLGSGVGFGSALTGTGGPVLLMPALMLLRLPVLSAIGASQVVQLPLALAATLGFWLLGTLDVRIGLILGVVQGVGAVVGAKFAHALPRHTLQFVVALVLLATAGFLLTRSFTSWS